MNLRVLKQKKLIHDLGGCIWISFFTVATYRFNTLEGPPLFPVWQKQKECKRKLKAHKDYNPTGKRPMTWLNRGRELLLSFLSPMCREDKDVKSVFPSSTTQIPPPPPKVHRPPRTTSNASVHNR